ncbi:MAG: helix-turn-helix transcriptional regulator [Gammaproteobacteria bacterium]|nr:helix-turn-helix transcriptional regulator [Gammaproteobacteria bacterium]MYK83829.1 helix-turn-helix transcriptional regulator [Gammaproteobacteria bacterium]
MKDNGLGTAIRLLRDRRTLSLREISQLSGVDHAYIHRLEKGEKSRPTDETLDKILRVLRADTREADIVRWLVSRPDSDPGVVEFALNDPSITIDMFSAAAGVVHRGSGRPDPATLFDRIRQIFAED